MTFKLEVEIFEARHTPIIFGEEAKTLDAIRYIINYKETERRIMQFNLRGKQQHPSLMFPHKLLKEAEDILIKEELNSLLGKREDINDRIKELRKLIEDGKNSIN